MNGFASLGFLNYVEAFGGADITILSPAHCASATKPFSHLCCRQKWTTIAILCMRMLAGWAGCMMPGYLETVLPELMEQHKFTPDLLSNKVKGVTVPLWLHANPSYPLHSRAAWLPARNCLTTGSTMPDDPGEYIWAPKSGGRGLRTCMHICESKGEPLPEPQPVEAKQPLVLRLFSCQLSHRVHVHV